ncbi:hypothetical protein TELCIR_23107, partial [Teladorsagia circumcincta]
NSGDDLGTVECRQNVCPYVGAGCCDGTIPRLACVARCDQLQHPFSAQFGDCRDCQPLVI